MLGKNIIWLYFNLSTFSKVNFPHHRKQLQMISKIPCDKNGGFLRLIQNYCMEKVAKSNFIASQSVSFSTYNNIDENL